MHKPPPPLRLSVTLSSSTPYIFSLSPSSLFLSFSYFRFIHSILLSLHPFSTPAPFSHPLILSQPFSSRKRRSAFHSFLPLSFFLSFCFSLSYSAHSPHCFKCLSSSLRPRLATPPRILHPENSFPPVFPIGFPRNKLMRGGPQLPTV